MNGKISQVKATLNRPIWAGGRTLYLGELICFALAVLVWYFHLLGNWSAYVALAVIIIAMIIW